MDVMFKQVLHDPVVVDHKSYMKTLTSYLHEAGLPKPMLLKNKTNKRLEVTTETYKALASILVTEYSLPIKVREERKSWLMSGMRQCQRQNRNLISFSFQSKTEMSSRIHTE